MNLSHFFRLAAIIGSLPVTLTNGTTADATQVMSDLNWIVNQVNANAAPLSNTALLNANNNFTAVQSGIAASAGANFPIASQVQEWAFNSLSSTLGTNVLTSRVAGLAITGYAAGEVFTFVPSQTNTGPANITVDAAGSSIIFNNGFTLTGGELLAGQAFGLVRNQNRFDLLGGSPAFALGSTVISGATPSQSVSPRSLLTGLGFSGGTVSGYRTITSGGALTVPHFLGRAPIIVYLLLKCISNDNNYTAGQVITYGTGADVAGAAGRGVSVIVDATNLTVRFGNAAAVFGFIDATTGANVALANANWQVAFVSLG